MRMAAIRHILQLQQRHPILDWKMIQEPLRYDDGTHRQELRPSLKMQGIWTPGGWRSALSFKSVVPWSEGRRRYADQSAQALHRHIYEGRDSIAYDLQQGGPEHPHNKPLLQALETGEPMIYFIALSPGKYFALAPVFVADATATQVQLVVGEDSLRVAEDSADEDYVLPTEGLQRHYAVREVKQRLHQASFRNLLLNAYNQRCAMSNLPEERLLIAAHIIPDAEDGQPSVNNGLLLASTYHSAYDSNLIGVDPDCRIHVSEQLLGIQDGPTLEAMKTLDKRRLRLPRKKEARPDPEALERRYQEFRRAQG